MNLDYPSQDLRERRSTQHLGPSCEVSPFACESHPVSLMARLPGRAWSVQWTPGARRSQGERTGILISLTALPATGNGLRTWKAFHLRDVLGIHGFRAAQPRLVRRTERVRHPGVLTGEEAFARQPCAPWPGRSASVPTGEWRLLSDASRSVPVCRLPTHR